MGAPSTGAKSLKCCGRVGGHQQQQLRHHQQEQQQQQFQQQCDLENNNYHNNNMLAQIDLVQNVNNINLHVNPVTVDYFTTVDETENHLNNNIRRLVSSASLSTVQTQQLPNNQFSTIAINFSSNKNVNGNQQKEINSTGFLKFDKKTTNRNTTVDKNQSSKDISKQKEKQQKKSKKSSGPPRAARMRPAGRHELEDPLMQRPRRKLTSSSKQQKFTQPPPEK